MRCNDCNALVTEKCSVNIGALYNAMCSLPSGQCVLRCSLCIVHGELHYNCTLCTALATVPSVQCTLHWLLCIVHSVMHFPVSTVPCTLCTIHCTGHSVQCTLHWSLYPVHNVHCTGHWQGGGGGGSVSATSGSFEPRPKLPVSKTVGGKTRPEIYLSPHKWIFAGEIKEFIPKKSKGGNVSVRKSICPLEWDFMQKY